jgi:hypothetical protein
VGLAADALGALFFACNLDYFIVIQNSQSLPGLAKNTAPRHRRQLIQPPGRYKKYAVDMNTFGYPLLQTIKCIASRQIFAVYQFIPRHTITQPNASANAHIKNWHSLSQFIPMLTTIRDILPFQKLVSRHSGLANFLCRP